MNKYLHTTIQVYNLGAFVSMDEFMIPTKIRHFLKQYIKGKPHKWGFKLYMTACPKGFCLHIAIHDTTQKTTLDMVFYNFSIFFFKSNTEMNRSRLCYHLISKRQEGYLCVTISTQHTVSLNGSKKSLCTLLPQFSPGDSMERTGYCPLKQKEVPCAC